MRHVKTVQCKLEPTPDQHEALEETLHTFTDACNAALDVATEHNTANKIRLQKLCYEALRERFGLSANLTIQAIRRVAAAYKAAKSKGNKPQCFQPKSVSYDQRIFSIREIKGYPHSEFMASLSTTRGRVKGISLAIGNYQRHLLSNYPYPKAATLTYDRKHDRFFLNVVLRWETDDPKADGRVVGIDLGINNLATTSNGLRFDGGEAKHERDRFSRLRGALGAKGTRSSIRTLNRSKGREHRWMRDRNHVISRHIVDSLEPGDVIALEDLTYIRERTQQRGPDQRRRHHSWAFRQLQQFLEYKALERGIAAVYVDPRNTSKSCSRCDAIGCRNGHSFSCPCGYRNNADYNAAHNLAKRGHARLAGLSSASPKATPVDAESSDARATDAEGERKLAASAAGS